MKHLTAFMLALTLCFPASAETMRPYFGIAADVFASDVDPQDYEGVSEAITEPHDGTGAAAVYAGVRLERFGIEAGWIFSGVTYRWEEEIDDVDHELEVETGGPYAAGTLDVYSLTGTLEGIHFYVKGGIERANRWTAKRDGVVTETGGSGVAMTGGGGARFEIPDTGLELRAELILRSDDPGTQHILRTGVGWRF